jgi:hypothetical protein
MEARQGSQDKSVMLPGSDFLGTPDGLPQPSLLPYPVA